MTKRKQLKPNSKHPIEIKPWHGHLTVSVKGQTIADTKQALLLKEASYEPVLYIPREDVDMEQLQRNDSTTYCPYKGDASYYDIAIGGTKSKNAVWTYEDPHESVEVIKGYLAFYEERVDDVLKN